MKKLPYFRYRHFDALVIMQCVRWYLRYPLSYRNLVEIMEERGVEIAHSTTLRWMQHYAPIFAKNIRYYARPLGKSWRVDETYIKVTTAE